MDREVRKNKTHTVSFWEKKQGRAKRGGTVSVELCSSN